jgi:hypothetical protein
MRKNLKNDRRCNSQAEKREGEIKSYWAQCEKINIFLRKKCLFSSNIEKNNLTRSYCLEKFKNVKIPQFCRDHSVARLLSSHLAELFRQRDPA